MVESPSTLVKEVERRLRVTDGIVRFLTVRVAAATEASTEAPGAGVNFTRYTG